jgi:hypothetical protein
MQSVPCPGLVRVDGILNMAVHHPLNAISPDLGNSMPVSACFYVLNPLSAGPKMYFAFKTIEDVLHHGSTKLHMDLTDAVNMMLSAAIGSDGKPGPALWHLFDAADAPLLRKFIREYCGFKGPGDPIHSQTTYLNPDQLELLFRTYGIRPYTFYQYPGQVVFIPAYCAHQVCLCIDVCLTL